MESQQHTVDDFLFYFLPFGYVVLQYLLALRCSSASSNIPGICKIAVFAVGFWVLFHLIVEPEWGNVLLFRIIEVPDWVKVGAQLDIISIARASRSFAPPLPPPHPN